jgi:hypothetical protein
MRIFCKVARRCYPFCQQISPGITLGWVWGSYRERHCNQSAPKTRSPIFLSTKSYSKWIFYMIYLYFEDGFFILVLKKQIWTAFFPADICKKRLDFCGFDGSERQNP